MGVIEASWNWLFGRKNREVYDVHGYAVVIGGNALKVRLPGEKQETRTPPLPPAESDALS